MAALDLESGSEFEQRFSEKAQELFERLEKNDLGGDYFSKQSLDSIVNNAVKSKFRGKEFVELTPEGLIKSFKRGNEGDVAALYLDSYNALEARRQAEPWKDDAGAKAAINEVRKEYLKYSATLVNRIETDYRTTIAELKTGNENEQREADNLIVNGTEQYKPAIKPDGSDRTMNDVIENKSSFDPNTVIMYKHNDVTYAAIKTSFGNIVWGHSKK